MTHDQSPEPVHVVGGGLSGSEAAWQIARRGVPVVLHEMRPDRSTAVHKSGQLAELVCSNSFRSDDAKEAPSALLHAEMRRLGSLVMHAADTHKLPAGGALAVDREGFAAAITAAIESRAADRHSPRGDSSSRRRTGTASSSPPARSPRRRLPTRSARSPAKRRSPSSTPSRPSCIATRSTSTITWFQSRYDKAGPARLRRRLHQLSADARAIRSLYRCAARRREDRVPRFRGDALFRRLPADRSDGRARTRDVAPRTDEAVRPDRSAIGRTENPMPWSSCGRTTSSARCSTWSDFRPS